MRVYFAHRLTGEDLPTLQKQLEQLSDTITELGHESFIFWRDIEKWKINALSAQETMERCLKEIDKSDMVFVYAHSDEKSEGMLIECGYAKAKGKPFVIAIRDGIPEHWLKHLGKPSFTFKDMNDLRIKMKKVFNNE